MKQTQKMMAFALGVAFVLGSQAPAVLAKGPMGGPHGGGGSHSEKSHADWAQKGGPHSGGGSLGEQSRSDWAQKRQQFKSELGLTNDQENQMRTIHQNFRQQHKAALDALKAKRDQARLLHQSGQIDEAKVLMDQIRAERQALNPKFQAMQDEMNSILTPEQQGKVKKFKENHKKHGRGHGGHGGQGKDDDDLQ